MILRLFFPLLCLTTALLTVILLFLEETKESRPPSDADPGETEILQLQSQQETGIVCVCFFSIC